ncbi:MAG TPA: ABC transporter ATP-binding protein [Phototrophicaceae bacterium]|nr:ABC transporter ATP-binding protein [Phototrophicaceae bacterium]
MADREQSVKPPPMIVARHLVKTFDVGNEALTVLKSVNLSIPAGQFVGIMGPSGSGKSTLLYLLGGLDRPTQGEIRVAGYPVTQLNSDGLAAFRSNTIGFVFQAFHLIPTLTALENVGLPGVFRGVSRGERNQRAMRLLTALGMADRADHRPAQLSGGQQQRVAIARALFNEPPIMMCDEPTGALDSKTGQTVLRLLRALCDRQHKTVIVVTHDPGIANYADRMVHFKDGSVGDDYLTRDRKEPQNHVA